MGSKNYGLEIQDVLNVNDRTLMVFVDETGVEDFSDPHNPTFGFGAVAVMAGDLKGSIKNPWQRFKKNHLGSTQTAFHTAQFVKTKPSPAQIAALNLFVVNSFYRVGVCCTKDTIFPAGWNAHQAMSLMLHRYIERIASTLALNDIAIIFEASERGIPLVKKDFNAIGNLIVDMHGKQLPSTWNFMGKEARESGLEVADLVAHTIGRQARTWRADKNKINRDFQQLFHKVDKKYRLFIQATKIELDQ